MSSISSVSGQVAVAVGFLTRDPSLIWNTENYAHCVKDLKDNKHNSLHLGRKYARIFVLGHYLFLVAHSFPRTTLSENCLEQIMSADKYPSIFSCQTEAIVYIFTLHVHYLRKTRSS